MNIGAKSIVSSVYSGRLVSLDAFRGFDMMIIIGFDRIFSALGRCIYGGNGGWMAEQMSHPYWFGLSFYDTVFPTFLFIAGISFPFSYARQKEKGTSSLQIHLSILKRAAILVVLGWVYNRLFTVGFADLRYGSVLGKIGIGWMIAALCYVHFRLFTRIVICASLVVVYAVLLNVLKAPDYPEALPFSIQGNFVGWVDRMIMPGKLYQSAFIGGEKVANLCEPSGILGNFFSSATAMLGVFAGEIVRAERFSGGRKTLHLLVFAAGLVFAGLIACNFVPISKKLWTPSFLLCVGGYSAAVFAAFYWFADVKGWKKWTFFFVVIGMNSITIYLLQRFVDFMGTVKFFLGGVASLLSPAQASLLFACGYLALSWLLLLFLYKKKIFLKV